jgi:protein-disulfide isomerase
MPKVSKRQEIREKRVAEQARQRMFAIGLMVVGAILIAAILIAPNFTPVGAIITEGAKPRAQANFNSMGDPNAPIKIQEFSDFQCSFCGKFWRETEPLIEEYYVSTGKVYFTYRSMGNWVSANAGSGDTSSQDAIMAAYCAGDQGKFWEYHDVLFLNAPYDTGEKFTVRRLVAMATELGLDEGAFRSCLEGGKYKSLSDADFAEGRLAGVTGTPSFLITYVVNGEEKSILLQGAQPFSAFQQAIESALVEIGE